MTDVDILVLRALNQLRTTHLPSYVALRMLLESSAQNRYASIIDAVITQATIRKKDRILELRRFKSTDGTKLEYRKFFVPSPSSALADSYALSCLHEKGVLKRYGDVFSYRPPPSRDYGRSFEHFAEGYRERNDLIASALAASSDSVAIVTDIANFYPSIDGEKAVRKLVDAMKQVGSLTSRQIKVAEAAALRAVSVEEGGLRVGLDMSHALASLYLTEFDQELRGSFPGRYFRYVDDVVIVVPPSDAEGALVALDRQLELLGLKRNSKKDAIADSAEWSGYLSAVKRSMPGNGVDCLRQLKFRIKLFLARHPEQVAQLDVALRSSGVYLPIEQLFHGSRELGWRQRVVEFVRGGWKVVHRHRFERLDDIVLAAARCRDEMLELLSAVMSRGITGESGSVARRWQVQGARFAINRALYFADSMNLRALIAFTEGVGELAEANAVCRALTGDFSKLALTPGPAVAAGTQLLALRGESVSEAAVALSYLGGAEVAADFEAHLSLRGLATPPAPTDGWPDDLRGLVALARSAHMDRGLRASRYGEEVSALAANYPPARAQAIAKTRFMVAESVVLDALSLDSAYGS